MVPMKKHSFVLVTTWFNSQEVNMKSSFLKRVTHKHTGDSVDVWKHVFTGGDNSWLVHREQISDCYKIVFAGSPYFENFRGQQEKVIVPSFKSFAEEGIAIFLSTAEDFAEGDIIAFAGCIPAHVSDVNEFVSANVDGFPREASSYMYMAELGVLEEYRNQGLGTDLILGRITELQESVHLRQSHLLVRTAKDNSNSLPLYLKMDAVILDCIQTAEDYNTNSKERIFLEVSIRELATVS